MITLSNQGLYRLIQTKGHHIKILYLDDTPYAWMNFESIGEILEITDNKHEVECILSVGQYRFYDVDKESELNDNLHLELEAGRHKWQGYILLTGLPNIERKRTRMIPTTETITENEKYKKRKELLMSLADMEY